jgi:hypothetical protein
MARLWNIGLTTVTGLQMTLVMVLRWRTALERGAAPIGEMIQVERADNGSQFGGFEGNSKSAVQSSEARMRIEPAGGDSESELHMFALSILNSYDPAVRVRVKLCRAA